MRERLAARPEDFATQTGLTLSEIAAWDHAGIAFAAASFAEKRASRSRGQLRWHDAFMRALRRILRGN